MKFLTILLFFCLPFTLSAQKQIKVKKGKVFNGDQAIAEYDGKGGAFRDGNYKLTAFGDTNTLIRFSEIRYSANNPMYPPNYNLYQVEFSSHPDKKFYYLPHPATFKILGQPDTMWDARKLGSDLIECFFNDTTELIIEGKSLSAAKVESLMAKIGFDYEGMLKSRKSAEDEIAIIAKNEIARDKTKPAQLVAIVNPDRNGSLFNIVQDGKIIGRLKKLTLSQVHYVIWKAAPAGSIVSGNPVSFVPIAQLLNGFNTMDKLYDLTEVATKKNVRFTTGNIAAAEYDIINLLIKNGSL